MWLECGGKSPNLVFDDADLDAAVDKAIFGAFYNQGAVCSSNSRLLLHASIAEEFLTGWSKRTPSGTRQPAGPASTLGAIVDESPHLNGCSASSTGPVARARSGRRHQRDR